jgi:miniconductance mechanosensitive channel
MEDKQELVKEVSMMSTYFNDINRWILEHLTALGLNDFTANAVRVVILLAIMILVSWLADYVAKRIIVNILDRFFKKTKSSYDDYLVKRKVFHKLAHIAPALVVLFMIGIVFNDFPSFSTFLTSVVFVYIVFVVVASISSFLRAVDDVYNTFDFARERPIKGYIQVVQIIIYSFAVLLSISILFGINLTAIIAGMGAVAAVILLIFKDTILGLVAGVQLTANNMVRIGDWISMPSHNADGTVLEITLNTVKVQNWDKTITTIPTYALVTNSFSNWRGMEESGGRRIKRHINIDMQSVKFLSDDMISKFKKIAYLKDYIDKKQKELAEYNEVNNFDDSVLVNGRRMTNLGVFRKYLEEYLHHHPKIHQNMTFLVRHLQPTEKGIPIELYVFSKDQEWAKYEAIQADIFDHILAVIPEFELSVFQFPTGNDLKKLTDLN